MIDVLDPALVLGGLWLVLGAVVATTLATRGAPEATVVAALVAWPFLTPLLSRPAATGRGPTIDAAVDGARDAILRVEGADAAWLADLEHLRRALHTMDRRLAPIEASLKAPLPTDDPALARARAELATSADAAAREIADVVSGLYHLRLQAGLMELTGGNDTASRISALRARMAALGEVAASVQGRQV